MQQLLSDKIKQRAANIESETATAPTTEPVIMTIKVKRRKKNTGSARAGD